MHESTSTPTQTPLRELWWLHPLWLFSLISLGTVSWAVAMPPQEYRMYFLSKYINETYFVYAIIAVLAFWLGYIFSRGLPAKGGPDVANHQALLLKFFWVSTALCAFAYLLWLGVGVKNGFSPVRVIKLILANDSEEAFNLKNLFFPAIPGVTTLMQCGMISVMLGILPGVRRQPYVLPVVAMIVMTAFVRAIVTSERLALIEIVVAMFIVHLRTDVLGKWRSPAWKWGMQLAAVLGPVLLLLVFGFFEYFRSYVYYQNRFNNIAEFTVWRVSAYYTLGHNNSALILEKRGVSPLPFNSISAVWAFPLVKASPLSYEKLTGFDPAEDYLQLLRLHGEPEYNNEGGLFTPLVDFGVVGYACYWCLFGFVCGFTYQAYMRGKILGVCFYPMLFLTLVETPRFIYIALSRATPQIVVLLVMWYLLSRRTAEISSPTLETAPQPAIP